MLVITIILTALMVITTIYVFYYGFSLLAEAIAFYFNKVLWRTRITRSDYIRLNRILTGKISYYSKLSANGRAKFVNRVVHFMSTKRFIGKQGLKVTEEMQVLVSASAVQLTLGLDKYLLKHFTHFHLYPTTFYSKLTGRKLKGGTVPAGHIMLSWKDYLHGYEVPDDNYNLGLHEMAHALKLQLTHGDNFDSRFAAYMDNWMKVGSKEFLKMKEGGGSFLRNYGGTNMHEFFSVCVEHFFESPQKFLDALPDIYNHLCVLLNQDPASETGTYELPPNFAEKKNRRKGIIPVPRMMRKKD